MRRSASDRTVPRRERRAALAFTLLAFVLGPPLAAQHEGCPLMEAAAGEPSAAPAAPAVPMEAGEAAFGAVAEMVGRLEADPTTDWSRVRIDRLREHLVDMHRVMVDADVEVTDLADGFRARVTSVDPRTAAAIGRMVPAHARMMEGNRGWRIEVAELPPAGDGASPGVVLTVRADAAAEAERLRALGFAGFLVAGDHHRRHHQAMALGASPH